MTHTRMVRISFFGGLALLLSGVLLIFSRKPFAYGFMLAGMALSLYFLSHSLKEVWRSRRIGMDEKFLWTFAFIFLNTFAGVLYYLVGRERVLTDGKPV